MTTTTDPRTVIHAGTFRESCASHNCPGCPATPIAALYPENTRFAWVIDGEMQTGTVADLARWAVADVIGYSDEPMPATVYAATNAGTLIPVPVRVERGPFVDDWADLTVTVTLSPGVTAVGYDRVDGRA